MVFESEKMNINDIIVAPEGTTLEFKENTNSNDKIIHTIIAFANTSGGRILIGISDKERRIIGLDNPHQISEMLAGVIHDSIEPRILPNIEIIPYRNTYLISIEIYPSSVRPHFIKSKGKEKSTYIRIGSTTRLADNALIQVIERSTITKAFDEEIYHEANTEEVDFSAAERLFKHHHDLQPNDFISLGILVKNGDILLPTIAGILLFGKNRLHHFPDAWIQVGVFDAFDRTKILDSQEIKAYFPDAIGEVLTFIKRNIRIGLDIGIHHTERWEIPKIALREAIINAIVHTDYSLKGAPIRILIFDDRIEIENSALLPWGLTFDDMKEGISKLRNPIIGRIFKEIGLIEQWGSGIRRMINACQEAGIPLPDFKEIGPRIRVTFYRKAVEALSFDTIDTQILNLFSIHGALSSHYLALCVNLNKRTVVNRLARLIEKKQIAEISQGVNDPKKKYTLIGKRDIEMYSCRDTKIESRFHGMNFFVRFRIGKNELCFIFRENTVDDNFLDWRDEKGGDNRRADWHEKAKKIIDKAIVSDPLFDKILTQALIDPVVQESFKKQRYAEYVIHPIFLGPNGYIHN